MQLEQIVHDTQILKDFKYYKFYYAVMLLRQSLILKFEYAFKATFLLLKSSKEVRQPLVIKYNKIWLNLSVPFDKGHTALRKN